MDLTDLSTAGKITFLRLKLKALIKLPAIQQSWLLQDLQEMLAMVRLLDEDFTNLGTQVSRTSAAVSGAHLAPPLPGQDALEGASPTSLWNKP